MTTVKIRTRQLRVVGERGLCGLERENTYLSFVAAGNRETHIGMTADVRRTSDGRFLTASSDTLTYADGTSLSVSRSTFDALRAKSLPDVDDGFAPIPDRTDVRPASAEEFLAICRHYRKTACLRLTDAVTSDDLPALAALITEGKGAADAETQVVAASADAALLTALHTLCPSLTPALIAECAERVWESVTSGMILVLPAAALTDDVIAAADGKGVILCAAFVDDPAVALDLDARGVPYVTSSILEKSEDADRVWTDDPVPYYNANARTILPTTIKFRNANMLTIAHQGYLGLEKENTTFAFTSAGNRDKVWGIETDVHRTADGKYVISHDSIIPYADGRRLTIEECSYDALRAVPMVDLGGGTGRADLRLTSLEEYIGICRRYAKIAVMELKTPLPAEDVRRIADVVREMDYLHGTVFISFHRQDLDALRAYLPDQPAQYLVTTYNDEIREYLLANRFELDICWPALTDAVLADAKAHGIRVNTWNIDDRAMSERFDRIGVDWITANIMEPFFDVTPTGEE